MKPGDFIRVREDLNAPNRAGKDGMVVEVYENSVALLFHYDRHNQAQGCWCVGPEMWFKRELDFNTLTA